MSVQLTNCEDGHILYIVISDPWNINDVAMLQPTTKAAVESASHKVHTLVSINSRRIPSGLLSARPSATGLAHPNSGQIVIVGAPSLLKAIAEAMFKVAHYTRSSFFSTEEEAWNYLRNLIAEEKSQAA